MSTNTSHSVPLWHQMAPLPHRAICYPHRLFNGQHVWWKGALHVKHQISNKYSYCLAVLGTVWAAYSGATAEGDGPAPALGFCHQTLPTDTKVCISVDPIQHPTILVVPSLDFPSCHFPHPLPSYYSCLPGIKYFKQFSFCRLPQGKFLLTSSVAHPLLVLCPHCLNWPFLAHKSALHGHNFFFCYIVSVNPTFSDPSPY